MYDLIHIHTINNKKTKKKTTKKGRRLFTHRDGEST